jgi:hypothetical protein
MGEYSHPWLPGGHPATAWHGLLNTADILSCDMQRSPRPFAIFATSFLTVAIWAGHCVALFRLYRSGQSDFIRFGLPPLTAFVLFVVTVHISWREPSRIHLLFSGFLALVLTFFSHWMGMFICLNTFGS